MEYLISLTVICVAVIVFHFIGYPVFLFFVSIVARRPIDRSDDYPLVSLVVSAYNEANVIEEKIKNCLSLDYPENLLEVIIVADGSNDDTEEIVKRYEDLGITLLHEPERRGKSAAVNRGFAYAKGEIVVFSDANAFYYPDAIKKLARNFGDPNVGGVSGNKTVVASDAAVTKSEGIYWRYESAIKRMESSIGSTVGVVGEMIAVRRELFVPIPPHFINDDACIMLSIVKAGYRVIYASDAICWESSAQSMKEEVLRRKRINAGRFQFLFRPGLWPWNQPMVLFQFISHKLLRLLLPVFMIGALAGNAAVLVMPASPSSMRWLFLLQCGFYGLALVGWVGDVTGRKWRLPGVAYYVTRSSLTSLQGFVGYAVGKQTVLWEKARGRDMAVK